MKRRRYEQCTANADGWSDWVSPIHGIGNRNYRLSCCDCELVHEMQFRVIELQNKLNVAFRVKRNNRATAAKRRNRRNK